MVRVSTLGKTLLVCLKKVEELLSPDIVGKLVLHEPSLGVCVYNIPDAFQAFVFRVLNLRIHTSERALEGVEHMMRKGQVKRLGGRDAAEQAQFVASLFGVAA